MLALGVMVGVACAVLGLPNTVLLGALAGVAEIIPLVEAPLLVRFESQFGNEPFRGCHPGRI